MAIIVPFGKTRLLEWDLVMPFDHFDFEFITRSETGFFLNARRIERELKRVNQAHHVVLTSKTEIEIGRVHFQISVAIYYYPSGECLSWWLPDGKRLSTKYRGIVDNWLEEARPVLVGTVCVEIPALRAQIKQQVLDRAMLLGIRMRDNAEQIIRYVGNHAEGAGDAENAKDS